MCVRVSVTYEIGLSHTCMRTGTNLTDTLANLSMKRVLTAQCSVVSGQCSVLIAQCSVLTYTSQFTPSTAPSKTQRYSKTEL